MMRALEMLILKEVHEAEKIQDREIPLLPIVDLYNSVRSEYFLSYTRDYLWGFDYA